MSDSSRFAAINDRLAEPRFRGLCLNDFIVLCLVFNLPFVFLLLRALNPNSSISTFVLLGTLLPLVVLVPLFLHVRLQQRRSTLVSETGFCGHCDHEIPPGKRSEVCQECGNVYRANETRKTLVKSTPALRWSRTLFLVPYVAYILVVAFGGIDGIFDVFSKLGFNPYAYSSSSGLVAVASSDLEGNSGVWDELQGHTLTAAQADLLARTVIAYREDPGLASYMSRSATNWFAAEIQNGTLSTPTLTRVFSGKQGDDDQCNEVAFSVLSRRTLSAGEHAALLDVLFTVLEDPERELGFSDYTLNDWFDAQQAAGKLTPSQVERARACNWVPDLALPDRIRVDEPFEIILGCGHRFWPFAELLSEQEVLVSVGGVAIDDGPFHDLGFETVRVLYSESALEPQLRAGMHVFPMEVVINEPGLHVIRIRYALFERECSEKLPSVERAADGSPILPEGAGWILERIFEREVVVEAD